VIGAILGFFQALPDLIALFKILQKRIREEDLNRKVHEDIKTINEAFDAKDASKLNTLFNGGDSK
jgi:hypothetical protein